MKLTKTILCCALALLLLWGPMLGASVLTASIPQSAVEENVRQAAAFYESADMFQQLWERDSSTVVHHYADAVLLNILWNQDSSQPLRAALDSVYYRDDPSAQGKNLAATVSGAAPNTSYARYWHGMLLFLKPLLTVTTMDGIKIIGAVALAALMAAYFVLLLRRKLPALAVGSAVGLVLVQIWIVPMCVEYYACFALMFLFADWVLWRKGQLKCDALLFLLAGALTCYFDFLTCELLTLGLPLLCLLLLRGEGGKTALFTMIRCCAAWLLAYGLTWLYKWGLSALVLGRSLSAVITDQALFWINGPLAMDVGFLPLTAIVINLGRLFPMKLVQRASSIWLCFSGVCLVLFALWYLFRREHGEKGRTWPLLLIALMPLVRFAAIGNHAILHPFFTYRLLFLTITAVTCALAQTVQFRKTPVKKGRKR